MDKITVYRFNKSDIIQGMAITPDYYLERKSIEQVGGTVIEDSSIQIEASMLDSYGKYLPAEAR
jgi:hypothetical protein